MNEVLEKIRQSMKENWIIGVGDAENAIDFVRDLIEINIEHTKNTEPYATNSIKEMEKAISIVTDLKDLLDGVNGE